MRFCSYSKHNIVEKKANKRHQSNYQLIYKEKVISNARPIYSHRNTKAKVKQLNSTQFSGAQQHKSSTHKSTKGWRKGIGGPAVD